MHAEILLTKECYSMLQMGKQHLLTPGDPSSWQKEKVLNPLKDTLHVVFQLIQCILTKDVLVLFISTPCQNGDWCFLFHKKKNLSLTKRKIDETGLFLITCTGLACF